MIIQNYVNPILFTSLMHLCCLIFITEYIYFLLVFISSISSFLWHYNCEKYDFCFLLDYFISFVLSIYEILYCELFYFAFILNISLFFINKLTDYLSHHKILSYQIGHSFFHIFSIFRIFMLSKYIK